MPSPHNPESFTRDPDRDPRTAHLRLGASTLPPYMQDPATIILSGSTKCPLPSDAGQESFDNLFFQTMAQGVSLNDDLEPQFFFPKTYLQSIGRIISERPKPSYCALGLNDIVATKNSPKHRSDPDLQSRAEKAIREYLDPQLFNHDRFRPLGTYEIDAIYTELSTEAQTDPMMRRLLGESLAQRERIDQRNQDALIQHYQDEYLEQEERDREELDRQEEINLFQYHPSTPISKVWSLLGKSPNRVAFERINALKLWRDHIKRELPDAHLAECVRSFQPEVPAPGRHNFSASDLYAVIAFNYEGHRCMIAECCDDHAQPSAAMKIWRGNIDDPDGWEQIFTKTKKEATRQGMNKNIHHANFAAEVASRDTNNYNHIIESENKLFEIAFHYFKTGELLDNDNDTSRHLKDFAASEFRRPNQ